MNAENFNFFWKASKEMAILREENPDLIDSTLGGFCCTGKPFDEAIANTLSKVKIFEIEENIKKLLALTDAPKINDDEYIRLPFDDIFLDVQFTREELEDYGINPKYAEVLKGIAVTKGNFIIKNDEHEDLMKKLENYEYSEKVGNGLRITMCSVLREDKEGKKEILFDVFNKNVNISEEYRNRLVLENPTSDKNLRDFVHKFVLNFLNFLNNPEVVYTEHKRSESNIRRKLKEGKPIIPSTMPIRITGKLKIYLDDIENKGLWHYGYRFWVRGHYRDLIADKWKEKKRIWIFPFIKGRGMLIEKEYAVTGEKNDKN